MKRLLTVVIAAAAVLGGTVQAAQADPINFLGAGGPLQFKYNDFETLITATGQELKGITTVTTIQRDPGPAPIFWTGLGVSDGTELNGQFKGLIANSISSAGCPPVCEIKFRLGELALYNVTSPTFNSTLGINQSAICPGGVCPTPWLTANFSPGILIGDNFTTLDSVVNSLTGPGSGKGTGFLDIGPNSFGTGTNDARFATKSFTDANGNKHDLFLESDIVICPGPGCDGVNPVSSHDPVHTDVKGAPEPASLLLLGAGLVAAAAFRRRSVTKG